MSFDSICILNLTVKKDTTQNNYFWVCGVKQRRGKIIVFELLFVLSITHLIYIAKRTIHRIIISGYCID